MKRREFIYNSAIVALAPAFLKACKQGNVYPVKFVNDFSKGGHLVREEFVKPDNAHQIITNTLIIGGGVSGLSAAWTLNQSDSNDFIVAELANQMGGNSISGKNEFGSFPWGAHYLPIPNDTFLPLTNFLKEAGVIMNNSNELNSEYLLHEPMERLFINGQWQQGLIPNFGLINSDKEEISTFFKIIDKFKNAIGTDGKKIFDVPLEFSSQDQRYLDLDKITFEEYLLRNKLKSEPLIWYLNYCMRDDYGGLISSVSAWAGIHYFACRYGTSTNSSSSQLLTWPQGNAFLIDALQSKFKNKCINNWAARKVIKEGDFFISYFTSLASNKTISVKSENVILATPYKVSAAICKELPLIMNKININFNHAPWLVANIFLNESFSFNNEEEISWDNVLFKGKSLGYVNSQHQLISSKIGGKSVLTWYQPLTDGAPKDERLKAHKFTEEDWKKLILIELLKLHPMIESHINKIDLKIWGHGMVLPSPGLIWGEGLKKIKEENCKGIYFAHSDYSGISIFEQAFYQGSQAAIKILKSK